MVKFYNRLLSFFSKVYEVLYILIVELLFDIIYTYSWHFCYNMRKSLKKIYYVNRLNLKIKLRDLPASSVKLLYYIISLLPILLQRPIWLYGGRFCTLMRFVIEPFWFIGAYFALLRYVWRLLKRFVFSGFHPMKTWQIVALLIVLFILLSQIFIFVLTLSTMLVSLRLINNLINIYFDRIKWNDKVMGRIKG